MRDVARGQRTIDRGLIFGSLSSPQRQMRIAAEQHGFAHALRKEVVFALRHDTDEPSELLTWPRMRRPIGNRGLPSVRLHGAERHTDERSLAAAVGSEHRVEFSGDRKSTR